MMAKDTSKKDTQDNTTTGEPVAAPLHVTGITQADIEKNKVWAVVSYLGIIGIIVVLVTEGKDSPFVKFHLNQALVLMIAGLIGGVVGAIIPIIGWFILLPIFSIATTVFMILGIINAAQGQVKRLPLIGNYDLLK